MQIKPHFPSIFIKYIIMKICPIEIISFVYNIVQVWWNQTYEEQIKTLLYTSKSIT